MGIARDGLRGLLDALVESIETGGNGEEVAARVHVSRFHFDRIVRAALDETPGAFRRRLLLERAAYSVAGGASVGDAALAGGYLSPEAFARAFRRAHGVAPSAFAGSGLPFRLPAPNGIHFHPPGALLVAGGERRDTMDLTDRLLEHDLWLTGRLLDAAEQLPADTLAEPLDVEGETIGSMLERLVWSKEMWAAAVEGRSGARAEGGLAGVSAQAARCGRTRVRRDRSRRARPWRLGYRIRGRHLRAARVVHLRRDGRPRPHALGVQAQCRPRSPAAARLRGRAFRSPGLGAQRELSRDVRPAASPDGAAS